MSKTAQLDDDVHALIVDKQKELKRRRSVTVKISDLIAMYVKHGVNKTEELLGYKTELNDDNKPNDIDGDKQGTVDSPEGKTKNDKVRLTQEVHQEVQEIKA